MPRTHITGSCSNSSVLLLDTHLLRLGVDLHCIFDALLEPSQFISIVIQKNVKRNTIKSMARNISGTFSLVEQSVYEAQSKTVSNVEMILMAIVF